MKGSISSSTRGFSYEGLGYLLCSAARLVTSLFSCSIPPAPAGLAPTQANAQLKGWLEPPAKTQASAAHDSALHAHHLTKRSASKSLEETPRRHDSEHNSVVSVKQLHEVFVAHGLTKDLLHTRAQWSKYRKDSKAGLAELRRRVIRSTEGVPNIPQYELNFIDDFGDEDSFEVDR